MSLSEYFTANATITVTIDAGVPSVNRGFSAGHSREGEVMPIAAPDAPPEFQSFADAYDALKGVIGATVDRGGAGLRQGHLKTALVLGERGLELAAIADLATLRALTRDVRQLTKTISARARKA